MVNCNCMEKQTMYFNYKKEKPSAVTVNINNHCNTNKQTTPNKNKQTKHIPNMLKNLKLHP